MANDLVGLHATDPATIYLSVWARQPGVAVEDVERALYDDRTVVRMLAMRRTMFVVPVHLVPVLQRACSDAVARRQRTLLVQLVEAGGLSRDPQRWVRRLEQATLAAIRERGSATAAELRTVVPGLRKQVLVSEGKAYETTVSMANRVLTVLAAQGRIVRGRPGGTWVGTQYRWLPPEQWSAELGAAVADDAMPALAEARVELVRRWLAAFGPGTVADLKWWTGWSLTELRPALATIGPDEVDLGGTTGLVLPDDPHDDAPTSGPDPSRGSGCCPRSTRRSWGGSSATGTSVRTAPRCSTATATPARRSGPTAGWSAAGRTARTAPSRCGCSRTSGRRSRTRWNGAAGALEAWLGHPALHPTVPHPPRTGARHMKLDTQLAGFADAGVQAGELAAAGLRRCVHVRRARTTRSPRSCSPRRPATTSTSTRTSPSPCPATRCSWPTSPATCTI